MEQKIPAISVVIPMYNAEKFIAPCIESLFAQTFRDFEVIVVDHASTDNSYNIVENYVQKLAGGGYRTSSPALKKEFRKSLRSA